MNHKPTQQSGAVAQKSVQHAFMLAAFVLILLSGLCSAALIYWLAGSEAPADRLFARERLGTALLIGNVVAIGVAGAVAAVSGGYAARKIAGPLRRFESLCAQLGKKNLDPVTRLKEREQLKELAQAVSIMAVKLQERRDRQARLLTDIGRLISILQSGNNLTVEQRNVLSALAQTAARFDQPDSGNS